MYFKQKQFILFFFALFSSYLCQSTKSNQKEAAKDRIKKSFTEIQGQVQEILWCGAASAISEDGDVMNYKNSAKVRTMYILTDTGKLYHSKDYGQTLKLINESLLKNTNTDLKEGQELIIKDILISPVINTKVFIIGNKGVSFYTDDCGKNYKKFTHETQLQNFQPHMTNSEFMIALLPDQCNTLDPVCVPNSFKLYLTQNSGLEWKKIVDNVFQAQWDKIKATIFNNENRIIASKVLPEQDGYNKKQIVYSDDFFGSTNLVQEHGSRFYQSDDYIFILTEQVGKYKLIIGPSLVNQKYNKGEIDLPIKRVKDESFTILDIVNGEIIISINHEGDEKGYTNVYISNSQGKQFTLSLQYAVGDSDLNIDFEPIQSNEGTYISNAYAQQQVEKYKSYKSRRVQDSITSHFNLENYKKTKITFDKGGNWHSLKPPKVSFNNTKYDCSGECSLQLKGRTEQHGNPLYSVKYAPGLVLATGNVGIYLTQNPSELKVYISRDGGHNWDEIQQGSWAYEIADQGGVIMLVQDDKATNFVVYTVDEGKTWEKIEISENIFFNVDEIVSEHNNIGNVFIIYGSYLDSKNEKVGIVISLDFNSFYDRQCQGENEPDNEDSDYETWIPINFTGKKCVFGQRVEYTRKKRDSQCFNSLNLIKYKKVLNECECTEEDFQCDYGFVKDDFDPNKCVPMNENFANKQDYSQPPDNCVDYYYVTQGYRKISNNNCKGGVEDFYMPKRVECPNKLSDQEKAEQDKKIKIQQQGYFDRSEEEIKKEIQAEYYSQNTPIIEGNTNTSSQKYKLFIAFIVLVAVYLKREFLYFKIKEIFSGSGDSKPFNEFKYDKKSKNEQQNNTLFNDDDEEEGL